MLHAVDDLHALVERAPGLGIEREPDALHRRHRDDVVHRASHLPPVDEWRLRDVVCPLIAGDQLLPPLEAPGRQVDGHQRVRSRGLAGPQRREVQRRRRSSAEVNGVRAGVDSNGRPDRPTADDARRAPPRLEVGRDRPERARPGRPQIGRVGHHEPPNPVLRASRADEDAVVRADRRARLRVAVVRGRVPDVVADRDDTQHLAVAWPQRNELHVELSDEETAVAVCEAPVGDDAEVLEERAVGRLVLPEHLAGSAVEREDVVVVRRHEELAADRERIRLLTAAHIGVELLEVDRIEAP